VKTKVTKADPKIVSTLIGDIADDPNPRLRYVVGRDAKMQLWLKRLLPWKRYEKVIAKAVKID
jgi:hypothetical protein